MIKDKEYWDKIDSLQDRLDSGESQSVIREEIGKICSDVQTANSLFEDMISN